MGVSGQDNLSWQMGHLPLNIVVSLLEQIRSTVTRANAPPANEQGHRLEQQRQRLKLGLDASLVGYKYVHDKSSLQPDHAIEIISMAFFMIAYQYHHHFGCKGVAPFKAQLHTKESENMQ